MSDEEQRKLLETVNLIAKDFATSEQIQQVVVKYRQFSSLDSALTELMMDTYNAYRQNDTMRNYYLEYIKNKFIMDFKNVAEMEKTIQERLAKNIQLGNMSLEQNHQLVESTIIDLCNRLNALGIDYYLVGALPCYIASETPLVRYHDDIDIMLNEDDIDNVALALQGTDYDFQDKRFNNEKYFDSTEKRVRGEHELVAQNRNNEFHLGFFPFVRGKEGEINSRGYFQTNENGENVTMICERPSTLEQTQLSYDERPIQYRGTSFRMGSLESVYNIKNHTKNDLGREKDGYDVAMLERSGKLGYEKAKQLQAIGKRDYQEPRIFNADTDLNNAHATLR